MLLSELYENLSYGMLANLAVGDEGSGSIPDEHQSRILSQVNRALTALYSRFILDVKELTIRAYDEITIYPLQAKYADTDATVVDQKFIADTAAFPFTGDVLQILAVYDEEGTELTLNDSTDENALFTPTVDTLQIPKPVTGNAYFVLYQAKHAKLVAHDLTQKVTLPDVLHEPLELYVAYRVLSSMNGQEHAAKAAEHYQRYELLCSEIEARDLLKTSLVEDSTKFVERGFA